MNRNRLGYIDTARGIAAVSVMFFHSILSLSDKSKHLEAISVFFNDFFDLGKISVIIFFVISGLVIPYSLNGIDKVKTLKKFLISRFFRLYPVYWLSAILAFVIFKEFSLFELGVNFTMLQQFIGERNIIGLYWTLQIELIFYFLIALVFVVGRSQNNKFLYNCSIVFLLIALALSIIRGNYEIKLPVALPLALSLMFFGSFYRAQLIDRVQKIKKLTYSYFIIYATLIPIICKLGYDIDFGYHESWLKYLITYYAGMILLIVICILKLSSSFTEYLGKISYSVYLFHPIFIFLVGEKLHLSGYYSLIIIILSTLLFSHLAYTLIEYPSINLGKKIKSKIVKIA